MTSPQPNGVILQYDVQYMEAGDSFFSKTMIFTCLTLTITGLTSSTTYKFRVAAVNLQGRGPFTNSTTQTTGKICITLSNK